MLSTRFLRIIALKKSYRCYPVVQNVLLRKFQSNSDKNSGTINPNLKLGEMASKYEIFDESKSEVVLDIYDNTNQYGDLLKEDPEEPEEPDTLSTINLERGHHGVYDIEDLIDVLKIENSQDIFVVTVPPDIKYVDYICVVSGKSFKHMQAIAQFVRKVYKKKMSPNDQIPKLEGANSKDWMALDLGNIALHIFSKDARTVYDLETLWAVGPKFDREYNKKDSVSEMLEKHAVYLRDLQPASK